jgi:hypothetical protein
MLVSPALGKCRADERIGLKPVITEDGVWRIRKREKVPMLEVYKLEESGYGDILSENFVRWRTSELPSALEMTAATSQVPASINAHANGTTGT